ncbi:MAG: amino acid-binding protein [Spirochaetae bacterium HGW-Spirochaetae-6]|nr:MAG: amino acid-binding protein [Spirochaetae bacterium HGW-Spirochaetae-6]
MKITQISVFLENKKGRLKEITKILSDNGINIRALSIAETKDFGVIRLIVNKAEEAYTALKAMDFVVRKTDVLAVEVSDKPGGLYAVLEFLETSGLNIEYMYAFVEKATDKALLVMRFDDVDKAEVLLRDNSISMVAPDKVYNL